MSSRCDSIIKSRISLTKLQVKIQRYQEQGIHVYRAVCEISVPFSLRVQVVCNESFP